MTYIRIIIVYFIINNGFLLKDKQINGIDDHTQSNLRSFASILGYEVLWIGQKVKISELKKIRIVYMLIFFSY